MKKVLMGLAIALMFFVLMIVLFVIVFFFFFTGDEEMLANGDEIVSSKEMRAIIQEREALLVDVDSLLAVLAQKNVALDSLERELAFGDATVKGLEGRLQEKDVELESLRRVEGNAKDMARTFATMSVAELTPIVAKLGDEVILEIFEHTTTKRRKFLLAALGDDRAAALTNRLVKQKGS